MRNRRMMIVTKKDVKSGLTRFYDDIVEDMPTMKEGIKSGKYLIPALILTKGVDNLTDEELVDVSQCGWAEMVTDEYCWHHKRNPIAGMIMIGEKRKGYILTDLYPNDADISVDIPSLIEKMANSVVDKMERA